MLNQCAKLAIGALVLVSPRLCHAQGPWAFELGAERSRVENSGVASTWDTVRAQIGFVRPAEGGWFAGVERQRRGRLDDVVTSLSGYRRLGDWTIGGGAAVAPDPAFVFQSTVEAQLSRRIAGTTVASLGYRHYVFRIRNVRQLQPALAWYHARGEVAGRLYLTQKVGGRNSVTAAISSIFEVSPRLRLVMAAARGDRIFDVAAIATENATASLVSGRVRIGITTHDFIEVGAGLAHEEPVFDQRTFSLMYRRVF